MDKNQVSRAAIEAFIVAGAAAVKTHNAEVVGQIADALGQIALDTQVSLAVSNAARAARDEVGAALLSGSLDELDRQLTHLAGAVATLTEATRIAKEGKDELTLPAIAKAADKALDTLKKLKEGIEAVGKDLKAATTAELGDIPQVLKSLVTDFKNLIAAA